MAAEGEDEKRESRSRVDDDHTRRNRREYAAQDHAPKAMAAPSACNDLPYCCNHSYKLICIKGKLVVTWPAT